MITNDPDLDELLAFAKTYEMASTACGHLICRQAELIRNTVREVIRLRSALETKTGAENIERGYQSEARSAN